jgi:hypothetical protein
LDGYASTAGGSLSSTGTVVGTIQIGAHETMTLQLTIPRSGNGLRQRLRSKKRNRKQ